jgi:hypothetical protein
MSGISSKRAASRRRPKRSARSASEYSFHSFFFVF